MRYSLYGVFIGAFVGICNFAFLFELSKHPSGYIFYMFLVLLPSYAVSLPWSLISIFTEGSNALVATIITVGAILNGAIIGAAYGVLKGKS